MAYLLMVWAPFRRLFHTRNHLIVGSSYLFAIQEAYNERHVIMTEISTKQIIVAGENNATFATQDSIAIFYQRLFDWYHSVPSLLRLDTYLSHPSADPTSVSAFTQ